MYGSEIYLSGEPPYVVCFANEFLTDFSVFLLFDERITLHQLLYDGAWLGVLKKLRLTV